MASAKNHYFQQVLLDQLPSTKRRKKHWPSMWDTKQLQAMTLIARVTPNMTINEVYNVLKKVYHDLSPFFPFCCIAV